MKKWIGTDESGKGDYFSGLVVAGVMVDESTASKLKELGVKDSKRLSDSRVKVLSDSIREICPHSVVSIGPERYNELYSRLRNLNRILGWAHARVIENLVTQTSCELVIADKFGNKRYIEKALMEKGKQIRLEQREKAESDPAVAAASILARDGFLKELKKTGDKIGVLLPKGAGIQVEEMAQDLVKKHGEGVLGSIAKVHFKTTQKLKANCSSPQDSANWEKAERLDRIWAPWRTKYIFSPLAEECIFCEAAKTEHRQPNTDFVLYRGEKAFVIMNIFPYNNGHLMVAPYRHTANVEELTQEEVDSLFKLVQKSVKVLKAKMRPQGFNIGMNLGKVAGAGIEEHLHIHIVPRWNGDTNFMPVVSETKVISQSLEEAYKLLKEGFTKI